MGELFGAELWINPLSQPGFIETHFFLLSVRWKLTKLLQKAHVIFKEFAQIIYAVTQHSEAFNTHAKSKARILLWINAAVLKHRRMNHAAAHHFQPARSEEHTSELQSRPHLVCRLLLEKKKQITPRSCYRRIDDAS